MKRSLAFLGALALFAGPMPALADSGQAYDQITKFQPNAEPAALEPGDFATDWDAAAAPAPDQPKHGGMFGKMRDAVSQAQGAMSMFKTGMAESHYVAGSKERIDLPAQQTATITDCTARTVTHLDLKAKTYYVISMDQPQTPHAGGGGRSAPGPAPTDDGTKVAVKVVNAALGPKTVFGNASSGYKSDITMVTTKPNGDSNTGTMSRKEYVSGSSHLWLNCSAGHTESNAGMMSALNRYDELARALATRSNSRFTFSASGPALPTTLAYFEAFQFAGGEGGEGNGAREGHGSLSFVIERDHIRSIGASDPVFSVPTDFTKVSGP